MAFLRPHSKSYLGKTNQAAPTTTSPKRGKRSSSCSFSFLQRWLPFRSYRKHPTTTTEETKPSASPATVANETATCRPSPTPLAVETGSISSPQEPKSGFGPPATPTRHNNAVGTIPASGAYGDTALSVLRLVLQALSAAARSVPLPGINLPFDALLVAFDKITTAYQNHQGFRNLTVQLQNLHQILLEIGQTRNPPIDLLKSLQKELEKLRGDIQRALTSNKLEQFINSTEDASSLTSHDNTIRVIVDTLILAVSARTGRKVDDVHDGVTEIQAGVDRIETVLSRSEERFVSPSLSQSFWGAKINTGQVRADIGGPIGSWNSGVRSQDFSEVDFLTGGGAVGSYNAAVGSTA